MKANPSIPAGVRIWQWISIAVIAGMLMYFAFLALDTFGLPNQTGVAAVMEKAYYPPGTSYETLNVGGRVFVRPYDTAEAYALKLKIDNQEAGAFVNKSIYDTATTNMEVQVTYRRCRFTQALRVSQVSLPVQKGTN